MAWVEGKEHKNSDRLGNKLGKRAWNRAKNAPYIYIYGEKTKNTRYFLAQARKVCYNCSVYIILWLQAHQKTTEEKTEGKTEKMLLSE